MLYGIDRGKHPDLTLVQPCLYLYFVTEIHRKIQSKYSVENEHEARAWIESVTGEAFSSEDFHESLKDGVLLCK